MQVDNAGQTLKADLAIIGGTVVTMDSARRIIENGTVLVSGDVLTYVGENLPGDRFEAAKSYSAKGCLVLPGLIDGHNHPGQFLSKGLADDVDILEWLYGRVYPFEANMTADDAYIGGLGNFTEMVRHGTTCFVDPGGYYVDRIVQAAVKVGIRGIVSRSTRDLPSAKYPLPKHLDETRDEVLARGEDLVKRFHRTYQDTIRAWFSLRVPYNISDELGRAIGELARKYGVGVHSHVAAQPGENERVEAVWGKRVIARYEALGLMAPNLYLVHMGWVNDQEIEVLAAHDVKVCHCPSASMQGAYGNVGRGTFPKMLAAGVIVSLGTDSATVGRFLDMVRVMYLAACAHREITLDPTTIGAFKALEMATVDGARAAMWDEIGSLVPGKRADLIIVDTSGPEWHPLASAVRSLIYSADGSSVRTVVINGRVVMQDRRFLTVDEGEVLLEVDRAASRVAQRAGIHVTGEWPKTQRVTN